MRRRVIRPTQVHQYRPVGQYVLATARVCSNRMSEKETTMFALIAFGAVLLVLIAALGLPYPQTWHGRWGKDG